MTAYHTEPPAALAALARQPGADECDICCEAIPGYVCGDLRQFDAAWLEEHTASCGYCRNELTGFRRLDHLLNEYESHRCEAVTAPPFRGRTREVAHYGTMDSPLGVLLIAVTDQGVCEIDFGRNQTLADFQDRMRERGFDLVPDQEAIRPVVEQLSEYFQGTRSTFDVSIDFSGLTPFARDVLQATAAVPFGGLATYSEIARRISNPGASRAVGNALGRNPIPIILPCHRIVPADRSIGNYTGGVDIKVTLLSLEGAVLPAGGRVS
ncbi:MAG: methylated-DNA--[protein]-cysteine S-methyltransferase [Thermomicrobiales bacterium]|nr:methylated-DNA--[protein]-cysteine S-methyltransferase [Thermomicrobiales bacterium]MCO5220474.1 methylated-DNA--[protein]-cysteine S-methyltransferase [Thermomicrobiales bacterium]